MIAFGEGLRPRPPCRKTVIVAGTYKTVNSRAKTIAKNDIKKNLKSDKYRTFVIKNLSGTLKINGDTIDID